jgi:hypothetical protein
MLAAQLLVRGGTGVGTALRPPTAGVLLRCDHKHFPARLGWSTIPKNGELHQGRNIGTI